MVDFPFRLPNAGWASAPWVQGNLDTLAASIASSSTITGDFTTTGAGKGMVCTTPNGLHTYRIAVDNNGSVTTEQLS